MKRSALVLWAASRFPTLARIGIKAWAGTYSVWPRPEHWLVARLRSMLGIRVRRRVRLVSGQFLYVDPLDGVGGEIAARGCYEPDTVAVFGALVEGGMVVVDAGAHVGQYTLLASQLVGPEGLVHAFEPDPITFGYLQANAALNRCANVRCVPVALSSEGGETILFLADLSNTGANSLRPTIHSVGPRTTVMSRTLDEYVMSADLQRLDVVKADVEGAELPLLRGGASAIARFEPLLILEFSVHSLSFGYGQDDLRRYLEDMGYALFRIGTMPLEPYGPKAAEPVFFNVLAVPRARVAALAQRSVIGSLGPCAQLPSADFASAPFAAVADAAGAPTAAPDRRAGQVHGRLAARHGAG